MRIISKDEDPQCIFRVELLIVEILRPQILLCFWWV